MATITSNPTPQFTSVAIEELIAGQFGSTSDAAFINSLPPTPPTWTVRAGTLLFDKHGQQTPVSTVKLQYSPNSAITVTLTAEHNSRHLDPSPAYGVFNQVHIDGSVDTWLPCAGMMVSVMNGQLFPPPTADQSAQQKAAVVGAAQQLQAVGASLVDVLNTNLQRGTNVNLAAAYITLLLALWPGTYGAGFNQADVKSWFGAT